MHLRKGFTLIELLIVVAIIAILAAIAVPNFLEAQVRAKVSRAKSDIRSVTVAVESFRVDHNSLLVDFWGDDIPEGMRRVQEDFGLPEQERNWRGGVTGIYVPLTTPISYITSVPEDPFAVGGPEFAGLAGDDTAAPYTFFYVCYDGTLYKNSRPYWAGWMMYPPPRPNEYIIWSCGPDQSYGGDAVTFQYDPTNGTRSNGDVMYSSFDRFDTPYVWPGN